VRGSVPVGVEFRQLGTAIGGVRAAGCPTFISSRAYPDRPLILIARKSMRADTAAQMFALFKAEQTNIKFGHGGTGTNSHMCGLLIQQALGVTFTSVPYRGTSDALLLGDSIDCLRSES
jgi:tripartite-type tricarboxylate transporter receptor subunit TctC